MTTNVMDPNFRLFSGTIPVAVAYCIHSNTQFVCHLHMLHTWTSAQPALLTLPNIITWSPLVHRWCLCMDMHAINCAKGRVEERGKFWIACDLWWKNGMLIGQSNVCTIERQIDNCIENNTKISMNAIGMDQWHPTWGISLQFNLKLLQCCVEIFLLHHKLMQPSSKYTKTSQVEPLQQHTLNWQGPHGAIEQPQVIETHRVRCWGCFSFFAGYRVAAWTPTWVCSRSTCWRAAKCKGLWKQQGSQHRQLQMQQQFCHLQGWTSWWQQFAMQTVNALPWEFRRLFEICVTPSHIATRILTVLKFTTSTGSQTGL